MGETFRIQSARRFVFRRSFVVGEFELSSLLGGMLSLRFNALLLFILALLLCVDAVCPYCFGNLASCTFGTSGGKCLACDVPVSNAGVVGGVAALAGTALTLTDVIRPRFLRIFTKAHLTAILQLVKRPQAGTIFEIKSTSKLASVLQAISVGQVTLRLLASVRSRWMPTGQDTRRGSRYASRLPTSGQQAPPRGNAQDSTGC